MNDIFNCAIIWGPVVMTLLVLIWMRTSCVYINDVVKFPARGHILIFTLLSAIPIFGILLFVVLLGLYITFRVSGDIQLKSNRFTKFWFDIDE